MEDRQFWDLAFMQICSIRFHPRNEVTDLRCEIMACADIADIMLEERLCRLHGQESPPPGIVTAN